MPRRIAVGMTACLRGLLQDDEDARGEPGAQRIEGRFGQTGEMLEGVGQWALDLEAEGDEVRQADEGLGAEQAKRELSLADAREGQVGNRRVAIEGRLVVAAEGSGQVHAEAAVFVVEIAVQHPRGRGDPRLYHGHPPARLENTRGLGEKIQGAREMVEGVYEDET